MKCDPKDLLLYAVTDRHWLDGRKLIDVVRESLDGGVTMLQLREKALAEEKFLEEARELQALCRERSIASLTVCCAPCDEAMHRALGFTVPLGRTLAWLPEE